MLLYLLVGIELGEMPAQYLLRAIAIDFRRCRVTCQNEAGRIEQKHREIMVALDQQTQEVFFLPVVVLRDSVHGRDGQVVEPRIRTSLRVIISVSNCSAILTI